MTSHLARRFQVVPDPAMAFDLAISSAAPEDAIFVTGSLYLVGEARRHWNGLHGKASLPFLDHAKHS
jgi:folylpolyglutamate synthase/dihydropteroate synthase